MTTAFPLLRLPYLVLMPILEQMEFRERIWLLILSKRARMYLKLLKMKCEYIDLKLKYDTIEMEMFLDNQENLRLELYASGYVEFRYGQDVFSCNTMGVPPMDYAVSIMDVLHCKSIYRFTIAEISQCNILPLLVNLPKIDRVVVYSDLYVVSPVASRLLKVLRIVLRVSSEVTISTFVVKPKFLREILKGNLDSVTIGYYGLGNKANYGTTFSLNDLRMTNAKNLELFFVFFSGQDINRFFKLWMKKKCNPRLEYLRARKYGNGNKDRLLKGLNAVEMPIRTDRTFWVSGYVQQLRSDEETTTEFDITRADGRQATIRISDYGTVCFYVWPESTDNTTNREPNQSSFMRRFSSLFTFYYSCIERFK